MAQKFVPPHAQRGELSPSYGDGGVMSLRMIHDPSVRFSAFTGAFADTSPRVAWGGKDAYSART